MNSPRSRIAALAVSVCVAVASWSAGAARADVARIDILPLGPSAGYGTGCTYALVATTKDGKQNTSRDLPVSFYDLSGGSYLFPQDDFYARKQIYVSPVLADRSLALWTPTRPGKHRLTAYQTSAGGPIRTITVRPGTPIGPGCLVR